MLFNRTGLLALLICLLAGCASPARPDLRASLGVVEAVNAAKGGDFARVTEPRSFVFPRDHGPHPAYGTEWWYLTGNLQAEDGRRFGYQLTIFRRGLPGAAERPSAWGAANIYMGHLAITDAAGGRFYAEERFSRDGADLAGASGEPFRVWLEDWSITGDGPQGNTMQLQAAAGEIGIDLVAASARPAVLQGDAGLSQKGPTAGNASYYYSLTRMTTSGTLSVAGSEYAVEGLSWLDREWGTNTLEGDVTGWDWFALQLDDGSDLMFYRLRLRDNGVSPYTSGSLVEPDGTIRRLDRELVQVSPIDSWRSPRTGTVYPSGWWIRAPELGLDIELRPLLADQELPVTVVYWEGAVTVDGTRAGAPLAGRGYVELTGYDQQPGEVGE